MKASPLEELENSFALSSSFSIENDENIEKENREYSLLIEKVKIVFVFHVSIWFLQLKQGRKKVYLPAIWLVTTTSLFVVDCVFWFLVRSCWR